METNQGKMTSPSIVRFNKGPKTQYSLVKAKAW